MTVEIMPDGGDWTLVFVRDLRHPPKAVWAALTDPAELDRWSPFVPSRDLSTPGDATLTSIDGDDREDHPGTVRRADAPSLLEYTWGDDLLRWELEPLGEGSGTRLTLRHTLRTPGVEDKVAAGWHLCLDQLGKGLDGEDVRAIRGRAALEHGWEELRAGYAEQFGR